MFTEWAPVVVNSSPFPGQPHNASKLKMPACSMLSFINNLSTRASHLHSFTATTETSVFSTAYRAAMKLPGRIIQFSAANELEVRIAEVLYIEALKATHPPSRQASSGQAGR